MSKVEDYKRKLEKHAKKRMIEAELFSIDEVLADSGKIREAYIEEIDAKVRYGVLTVADLAEIMKAETDEDRAIIMLYKMLAKADENVTLEKVKALPIEAATAILTKLTASPLQRIQKRLKGGSERTQRPTMRLNNA